MKYISLLIISFLMSQSALAYIPHLRTILKNTAEKRADSAMFFEKEVIFKTADDKILIKEKWYVKNDSQIYIEASGPGFDLKLLHKDGYRYRVSPEGKLLSSKESLQFYGPLFFSNDPNYLAKYFVEMGLADSSILRPVKPIYKLEDIQHTEDPNVRLTRLAGKVTYGIGPVTPKDSPELKPQVWLEQDLFHLLKLRAQDFVVEAENFNNFARGMHYPKRIRIKTPDIEIEENTFKVSRINVGPKTKKKFKTENLKASPSKIDSTQQSLRLLENFYLQYR